MGHRVRRALASAAVVTLGMMVPLDSAMAEPNPCGDPVARPWCDQDLSADARAGLLLEAMTLDEKISLLAGEELLGAAGVEGTHTGTSHGIERLGIPTLHFSDGPVGPRQGQATQMPSPMSVASSFSDRTAYDNAMVIADEVKRKGNDVVFAPGVNIGRTPVNGRTFEYFGEDPYLAGRIATGFVRGVQDNGVIANVKHYAVNNQEGQGFQLPGAPIGVGIDGSRLIVDARVDERTLREIYLPAFEATVKQANVGTVMCSYNRVNGQFACENQHLLNEILKRDWNFHGLVLTDYGAAKSTANSLNNGLDLDIWPGLSYNPVAVHTALATSQASESSVDEHVHRILRTMFEFGVFDRPPYVEDTASIDQLAHHEAAARVEAQGMTLLKNENQTLPLSEDRIGTLAVIGPEADVIKDGGGSSAVDSFRETTPLAGLRARLGASRMVYDDGSDLARAGRIAASADAAVVVVGDNMAEGVDKTEPTLNAGQVDGIDRDALVTAVGRAQPNTVAVLQSGGPVLTPWRGDVPAILEMWYPGQNGGTALARVLFGDEEPGGRLPMTFPNSAEDLSTTDDRAAYPGSLGTVEYKEGVLVGYRHFDANGIAPAFPFGHGLSYTNFEYSRPVVERAEGANVATVRVRVTNTGDRTGSAVPQLYLGLPQPTPDTVQPPKQLKGFTKLNLEPGESREVRIPLSKRALSYWDTSIDGWRIADGCYRIMLGESSRDIVGTATAGWQDDCGRAAVRIG